MAKIPGGRIFTKDGKQPCIKNRCLVLVLLGLIIAGCTEKHTSDAYGQFEVDETTISSQASGQLLQFTVDEGYNFKSGQQVGYVDTTQLALKKDALQSQLVAVQSRITNINAQVEVQQEQLSLARTNLKRIRSMHDDNAATSQQLDDARTKVLTLEKKIDALETQKQSIRADVQASRAGIQQINEQIKNALIINPIKGTVLTSFAEPYEVVRKGQPLYRIANLDTLTLRVYISGAQLPHLKLGQKVQVLVDKNEQENRALHGTVTWIASEAEFTPQQIQTKEERVSQVYAIEVHVPNPDGSLKIGMPGEINFDH